MNTSASSSAPATSPYPGLRPFTKDESAIFFGRDDQTDRLLEKLASTRFLMVVGPSGCGKSSLVRAGLMADLEGGFMNEVGARWEMAEMRPGNHPFMALAHALLAEPAFRSRFLPTVPSPDEMESVIGLLRAALHVGPLGLVEVLKRNRLPDRTNFFLLIDQFEELFTAREAGFADETDAFVALLLATAAQGELPLFVVVTMRTSYLGDCPVFPGLVEAVNQSLFLTPRLDRKQRHKAIVGPAKLYNGDIDPELVNHLLNKAGSNPDQLPLLQHLLMRMWSLAFNESRLTDQKSVKIELGFPHYRAAGGFERALSVHAGAAFKELDKRQKQIAQVLFRAICELGPNGRERRRLVGAQMIAELAGATLNEVTKVADVFRCPGRNFLMPPIEIQITPETNLDISHEALIRNWDKLREWVQAEADSAKIYLLLEQTARRHKKRQAALWDTPDLEVALKWEKKEHPPALWAKLYGGDYSLAMRFLRRSKRRQEYRIRQKQQEQEAREESLRQLAEQEKLRADAERSLREIQEKSRRTAIERSQNYVCRAKQGMSRENRPKKNVIALYYLSIALRLDQANSEAAELAYKLLLSKNWFSSMTSAIRSSSQILAGSFSPDALDVIAVEEDGHLLRVSSKSSSTTSSTPLFPEIEPPLGGKLLVSASFSGDGQFLLVGFNPVIYGAPKAQTFRWSESNKTYQPFCDRIDLDDPFRHPVVWSEDASLLITLSQKFDGAAFQVFQLDGEIYREVTSPFGETEVTAAAYAKEMKQVITASPGGLVRFWDASSLQHSNRAEDAKTCIKMPKGGSPYLLALGPEKDELTVLVYSEPLQIVNFGKREFRFVNPATAEDIIAWFAFGPDADARRRIAITSNGRVDIVYADAPEKPLAEPLCFQGLMGYPIFSPDGNRVLILSGPFWHTLNTIQMWNTGLGKPLPDSGGLLNFDGLPAPAWFADLAEAVSGAKLSVDEDDPACRSIPDIAERVPRDQVQGPYRNVWRHFLCDFPTRQ